MATTLTDDGAWCWFQDPRAVHHAGEHDRTYAGWVSVDGDVEVASYDHDDGVVTRTTLHADFERDDHDAPTFHVDAEGRLLVVYSGHNGPSIHYRRSETPEDVSAFGPERSISPSAGHTYPSPRQLGDTLYLLYRNAAGSVACVTSTDDGRTWSAERELVTTDGRDWCVYRKASAVRDGAVDLGLTFAAGGGHDPHRDVRHLRFDGETLATADGTDLGRRATFWDAPVVYDSDATGHDAWIWDCAAAGGAPELAYAELRAEDDHRYRYATWTGESWRDVPLADGGSHVVADDPGADGPVDLSDNPETYYSGGVVLDHDATGVCYYSTGDHDGSALVRATTDDDGASWERTELLPEGAQNLRPVVPRDAHADLPVLWMQGSYTFYVDAYDTAIVGPDASP
jgi:hypothetical protein